MDLARELIVIGREFKISGQRCHGDNYTDTLRKKYPNLIIRNETVTRALRKLRENGIFETPEDEQGYFYINNWPSTFIRSKGVEING